jgi:Transposase IS4
VLKHFIFRWIETRNNDGSAAVFTSLCSEKSTEAMVDSRRVVGGTVWAKSTSVSRDCKRIYGVECDKTYLCGVVIEVLTHKPDGARRATTLIKAKYKVGDGEKIQIINLAQLKKENPNPPTAAAPVGDVTPASSHENSEQSSTTNDDTHPPTTSSPTPTTTTNVPPATVQTTATSNTNSTGGSSEATRTPTVSCHGTNWFEGGTDLPTNGPFTHKTWKLTCQYNSREYTPLCDEKKDIPALDYFLSVFPAKQLNLMVEQTSKKLTKEGKPKLTKGECLKWLGVLLLITRFEFGDRANLWATQSHCKYVPAANFGERTGMTRDRFHDIFRCMVWSVQPPKRPDHMSSEQYRWLLIEDFIANFNEHRSQYFHPGWLICVDESMSRWYGLGGHWINMGLPMYVAIDRKPEDGMEIQNACCGHSNIMMQLKLVKTASANAENAE